MDKKVEKWSLRYWMLKEYVIFANWLFHRQFVIRGIENIPPARPVVYAPNHQNALSDALALVCSVPHQTLWLTRADIFQSAIARPLLKFMKMIPVYRIRDGKENLSENEKTFEQCVSFLKKNQALGLFPEAAHSGRRQMLPHKKAVPRIVFLAEEMTGFSLDIQIVPVGIFYDQYHNFGRRLMVTFGKPLAVMNYRDKYLQNQPSATMALRNDLHLAILSLVLNFETKTSYEGFEAIRSICTREFSSDPRCTGSLPCRLEAGRVIEKRLDELEETNPGLAQTLANNALELEKMLKSSGLRSWLVDINEESYPKLFFFFLYLLLTSPLFIYGFIFNGIPFFFLDQLIKNKVKQAVFRSTFSFGLGLILFPLTYIIELMFVSPLLPGWLLKAVFILSLPFAGKFAFSWYILFLKMCGRWRWLKIKRSKPEVYNDVHRKKQEIIDGIASEFFS